MYLPNREDRMNGEFGGTDLNGFDVAQWNCPAGGSIRSGTLQSFWH